MKIVFLKENSIYLLKKRDLKKNIKFYNDETNAWILLKYRDQNLSSIFDKKEFNDFELKFTNKNDDDLDNMKIIYDNLKELTDSQASDERIWSGLAHYKFWDYMQKRWPMPDNKDKQISHVLNNYFFWNSTKAVFLNGLSRLWWYARYTYDERYEDPYELTKYICNNDINGKIYPLISCKFAVNKEVFKNILISIKNYEEEHNINLSREEFLKLKEYLNRLSGKVVIDLLTYEELNIKIINKLDKITQSTNL